MRKSYLSWGALFACNLMWSLQFTCIKLVQGQVGAFSTVFIPMLLATLFMVPFVYKDIKANKKRKFSDLKVFLMLALLGQFPAQVLMTIGTQQSTASNGAIISLTLPVVSALLAVVLLKEKMNGLRWVSFIIAIIGVALCSLKDILGVDFSMQYIMGNALIFAGVLGSGFYNTICKKISLHTWMKLPLKGKKTSHPKSYFPASHVYARPGELFPQPKTLPLILGHQSLLVHLIEE